MRVPLLLVMTMCSVECGSCLGDEAAARLRLLTTPRGAFSGATRDEGEPLPLVRNGRAVAVFDVGPGTPQIVRTAIAHLNGLLKSQMRVALPTVRASAAGRTSILPLIGEPEALPRLQALGCQVDPAVGPQGFVIQRVRSGTATTLVVWSPHALGCRYGLIDLMRSLQFTGDGCHTTLTRVVSRPYFPLRIYYLNFGEHLQNAYNVNMLFDTPQCRWSLDDWKRFIDMISAMRYNVFSFWLVPTLFDPAALHGGAVQERFAQTMCEVIRYAHRQGVLVEMLVAVNTVGPDWCPYCPKVPEEHEMILKLWEHWTRRLGGLDIVGLFPGDPGGCTRNGCDYDTCVDLYEEIIARTRGNGSFLYEVATWGAPFFGWGVNGFGGGPDRAKAAFAYLGERLPHFPDSSFVSICMGLNPDSAGDACGGNAEPYVRAVSTIRPVTTWDYAISEGEMTVIPRFRVAGIIQRRRAEAALPYIGGINYTMTPALNQLQPYAAAECYWDPNRTVEGILDGYSRLALGAENESLGRRVFPYTEVVGDWGGGGWGGDLPTLAQRLAEAKTALASARAPRESALLLFPSPTQALDHLRWHVDLLLRLAEVGADIEEGRRLIAGLGGPKENALLVDAEELPPGQGEDPERKRLAELLERIRAAGLPALRQQYWDHVYGINDAIRKPGDPRAWGATDVLFGRFHFEFVVQGAPSRLERLLKARGEPYLDLDLGNVRSERGWQLTGWVVSGEFGRENWRASTGDPGVARRADFTDRGYRYVVLRIADDLVGGRKTVWVNGAEVGTYVRPAARLEWTTQQFPIPAGALHDGELDLRVTGFGVAISDIALVVTPLTDEEIARLRAP